MQTLNVMFSQTANLSKRTNYINFSLRIHRLNFCLRLIKMPELISLQRKEKAVTRALLWLQMIMRERISCGKCWLGKMKKIDKCLFLQQCIHCIDMQDLDMTDHNERIQNWLIWNHLSSIAKSCTEWNTFRSTLFTIKTKKSCLALAEEKIWLHLSPLTFYSLLPT